MSPAAFGKPSLSKTYIGCMMRCCQMASTKQGMLLGISKQFERRLELPIVVARAAMGDLLAITPPWLCLIWYTLTPAYFFHPLLYQLTDDDVKPPSTDFYGLVGATAIIYIDHIYHVWGASFYDKALQTHDGVGDEFAAVEPISIGADQTAECLTKINECLARAIEVALVVAILAKQLGWVCVVSLALVGM
ncbi:hypothetical protein MY3296_009578 [Beauveria thailandica]